MQMVQHLERDLGRNQAEIHGFKDMRVDCHEAIKRSLSYIEEEQRRFGKKCKQAVKGDPLIYSGMRSCVLEKRTNHVRPHFEHRETRLERSLYWATRRTHAAPAVINYSLVSSSLRPLISECVLVKSIPCGPHYGVNITLSVDSTRFCRRNLLSDDGRKADHQERKVLFFGKDLARVRQPPSQTFWEDDRRNTVFAGNLP